MVLSDFTYERLEAFDSLMCAFVFSASIRVKDESAFKVRLNSVDEQVMGDTVFEVSRKNFSEFRVGDHKTRGGGMLIGSGLQEAEKRNQSRLSSGLVSDGDQLTAFIPPAGVVGSEEVRYGHGKGKCIHNVKYTCV